MRLVSLASLRIHASLLTLALTAAAAEPAKEVTLDPGLGNLHWAVSTKNAKSQAYFDQGMRYVYAFNHEAAIRSFDEATRLDPELGIGYWGTALALGPNINLDVDPDREKQAYEAVHNAEKHLGHASQKEKDLVAALGARYSVAPNADLKKLAVDYGEAGVYPMMYYSHNLQFGAASYTSIGDLAHARAMAEELARNVGPMLKEMPPIEVALAYPTQVLTRFGRWNDVLKAGAPDEQWPIS